MTGRTHQIRVHLQYLGFPIANDPLYAPTTIWGQDLGKGGVDLVPAGTSVPSSVAAAARLADLKEGAKVDLQDREYSNIDVASPIRLSQQARDVIAKLRRQRDEQEDWIKWKEVVFSFNQVREDIAEEEAKQSGVPKPEEAKAESDGTVPRLPTSQRKAALPPPLPDTFESKLRRPDHLPEGFCEDCFVPVADDPDPETLFIFLHAMRYTTPNLGAWATPLPKWAEVGWGGDWRGWSDQPVPEPFDDEEVGQEVNGEASGEMAE